MVDIYGAGLLNKIVLSSSLSISVTVCPKVEENGHTLTLKSLFTHHPPPPPPPENFFWSQMKGMAKIRLFYSGDMELILPQ